MILLCSFSLFSMQEERNRSPVDDTRVTVSREGTPDRAVNPLDMQSIDNTHRQSHPRNTRPLVLPKAVPALKDKDGQRIGGCIMCCCLLLVLGGVGVYHAVEHFKHS